ncbi:hypothetical protein LCL97_11545 [Seohaeicola saemankumensis]|nr:hypothetical protein [Seohaeicola saemankumensis]MCA0871463.1 hypothetical protein [Seohaeicola saemankumensis]
MPETEAAAKEQLTVVRVMFRTDEQDPNDQDGDVIDAEFERETDTEQQGRGLQVTGTYYNWRRRFDDTSRFLEAHLGSPHAKVYFDCGAASIVWVG